MLRTPAPLKGALAVGRTMSSLALKARNVSIGLGIFGVGYIALAGMLLRASWTGSVEHLWSDIQIISRTLLSMLAVAAIHIILCIATFRYVKRSLLIQRIAFASVVLLAVAAVAGAAKTVMLALRDPSDQFIRGAVLPSHLLSAIGYVLLAWVLGQIYTALNGHAKARQAK